MSVWRVHHRLESVNALSCALGGFIDEPSGDSPLRDLGRRPRFRGAGDERKQDGFYRTMPRPFREKCVAVWRRMFSIMELRPLDPRRNELEHRPLDKGEIQFKKEWLAAECGISVHCLDRILRAGRDAGLLKIVENGRRRVCTIRRATRAFYDRVAKHIRVKLNRDGDYLAKRKPKPVPLVLTRPAAAYPALPDALPPPPNIPDTRTGFLSIGAAIKRTFGGGE